MTAFGNNSFSSTASITIPGNSTTALHHHHHNNTSSTFPNKHLIFNTSTNSDFISSITMNQQHPHWLLEQIEGNTLSILELDKEVEEVFDSGIRYDDITLLLRALSTNESIRCIRFEGDFLDCLHPRKRSDLLQVVGSYLPGLRHVGLGDSPLLVADLCHLLQKQTTLKSLRIHDSILQGTAAEFEALEAIVASHSTIEDFEIHECTSAIPGKANLQSLTTHRAAPGKKPVVPPRVLQQRSTSLLNSKRYRIDGGRKI